jgi:hypothetical protein
MSWSRRGFDGRMHIGTIIFALDIGLSMREPSSLIPLSRRSRYSPTPASITIPFPIPLSKLNRR